MQIEGFESGKVSYGDLKCAGGHPLRRGSQVWWRQISVEHDEWEPYCRSCAQAYVEQRYDESGNPI